MKIRPSAYSPRDGSDYNSIILSLLRDGEWIIFFSLKKLIYIALAKNFVSKFIIVWYLFSEEEHVERFLGNDSFVDYFKLLYKNQHSFLVGSRYNIFFFNIPNVLNTYTSLIELIYEN